MSSFLSSFFGQWCHFFAFGYIFSSFLFSFFSFLFFILVFCYQKCKIFYLLVFEKCFSMSWWYTSREWPVIVDLLIFLGCRWVYQKKKGDRMVSFFIIWTSVCAYFCFLVRWFSFLMENLDDAKLNFWKLWKLYASK